MKTINHTAHHLFFSITTYLAESQKKICQRKLHLLYKKNNSDLFSLTLVKPELDRNLIQKATQSVFVCLSVHLSLCLSVCVCACVSMGLRQCSLMAFLCVKWWGYLLNCLWRKCIITAELRYAGCCNVISSNDNTLFIFLGYVALCGYISRCHFDDSSSFIFT